MSKDKYKILKSTKQPKIKHRRTKKQLIAAGYYDNKDKKSNSISAKQKNADNENAFKSHSMTAETLSERQINKAKEQGLKNWEHDLRNDYERGNIVYYVEINPYCHTKELIDCKVRTVYAKSMICTIEDGECRVIGIEDIDKVFATKKDANHYYKHIRI